jgi:hypothetical protein
MERIEPGKGQRQRRLRLTAVEVTPTIVRVISIVFGFSVGFRLFPFLSIFTVAFAIP